MKSAIADFRYNIKKTAEILCEIRRYMKKYEQNSGR